ncbi:PaaI family thioesterase [Natronomonas sp.]|uniref:PaaI family thioesterase n=1 Tax=Natronomonas sp. TaxID=2184060 RepID=UPI002FC3055E
MTDVEPHDVPDEAVAMLQEYLESEHQFLSWLGFTVEEFDVGRMVGTIPFDDKLTNPTDPPTIQGGVASTLIDVVGGIALRPYLTDPLEDDLSTINLNVNYLRPATDDLTATAEVIRAGSSVGVSYIEVTSETPDGEQKQVAVGMGAYRLFRS